MTFHSEPNRDAMAGADDTVSTGPSVGFLEAFNTAYEAQTRAASQFGIEYHMSELDNQQTKALRDAGMADAPSLIGELTNYYGLDAERFTPFDDQYQSGEYLEVARNVAGEGDVPWIGERSKQYDDKIKALRIQFPDLQLRTSDEMFKSVRDAAQEAERKEATDRRTWGGAAGGFLGGTLASMDPRTDPLNFATLGLGGAGKTAVQRILVQGGAQGVVEVLNQVTGVQEERRLQGLSHGFGDAAMRVGATAVGGAALQGAGEALVAGARRFFRNTPTDPAPAPAVIETPRPEPLPLRGMTPDQLVGEARVARLEQQGGRAMLDAVADETPLSGLRVGRERVATDLADMTRQLEDWAAGPPAGFAPRTAVAAYPGARPDAMRTDFSTAVENNTRYQAARENDPVIFNRYETLAAKANTYRRWLGELGDKRDADAQVLLDSMDARLDQLEVSLRTTQGKNNKAKVRQQIAEVRNDRQQMEALAATRETPDISRVRRELVKADEQMRGLAPMLGRAYARADGRWQDTASDLDAVWAAYRAGKVEADPPLNPAYSPDTLMTLYDRVPALQRAPVDTPPNKPVTDVVREVIAEDVKIQDEALEVYRSSIRSVLSENGDGTVTLAGTDHTFNLTDRMFDADGNEVTVREMLDDLQMKDQELEAFTSCSIR